MPEAPLDKHSAGGSEPAADNAAHSASSRGERLIPLSAAADLVGSTKSALRHHLRSGALEGSRDRSGRLLVDRNAVLTLFSSGTAAPGRAGDARLDPGQPLAVAFEAALDQAVAELEDRLDLIERKLELALEADGAGDGAGTEPRLAAARQAARLAVWAAIGASAVGLLALLTLLYLLSR